jgi:pilus assembly protein CpaC
VQAGQAPPGNNTATSEINNQLHHQPASFGTNDLLNLFLFRTDANIGAIIKALQQKNVLQLLAEPNLIAVNGKQASFLAGGEFPFPVSQGISGAVTIQFKEFGVRLNFVPLIMPNGNIHLQVRPEVSALDFSNALTVSGFVIPAISTRRAETEFEVRDGQSCMIAVLLDNRVTNVISKIPGLGDIPILGTLFKSKSLQRNKSELMVLVTARRVNPSNVLPEMPKFPYPFMDQKEPKQNPKDQQPGASH